jgi:hypothetical protein
MKKELHCKKCNTPTRYTHGGNIESCYGTVVIVLGLISWFREICDKYPWVVIVVVALLTGIPIDVIKAVATALP